ncbi:fumarate reductase subunit FrdC [Mixta tenebrionis]|uniref:Fumarate reductase subunit C n=1 Tax=Mixta tenebrionis TaxID=2562439 RepID=A0A506V6B2_9GAMM|nr:MULTISPECIES: fumarate reductase subunit FrdC [Mixta]QHM77987.1 Fumarate reductase subunit C [Mixta theicola]TPW40969.1 fumarate reductase subunit FrdC [Mixta tenebrionis]
MISKRKPWSAPVTAGWWRQLPFYRFYMLREGTAIPALWFSLELIFALYALKHGAEQWASFVAFLQNPLVLVLNLIALAAALLHSKTWFELAPKAAIVMVKGEKLQPRPVIIALWIVTLLVSIAVLWLALNA